jgi:hypothetical protein
LTGEQAGDTSPFEADAPELRGMEFFDAVLQVDFRERGKGSKATVTKGSENTTLSSSRLLPLSSCDCSCASFCQLLKIRGTGEPDRY